MPASADHITADLPIAALRCLLLNGSLSAEELAERALDRIAGWDDPALWIARADDTAVRERARRLDAAAKR
ncbi:MAG TPA: hypothetical protein VGI28_08160, partial [Stellaceae bacterium]